MTARQIRRAAERKARKAEQKDEAALYKQAEDFQKDEAALYKQAEDFQKDEAVLYRRAEDSKNEINRAAAQRNTGPRTPEGKAISSQNALKTALTGRTVLLPTEDRVHYERHLAHYFADWNPVGEHECILVQTLADTWWRLTRIPALESALYAKGRLELTDCDPDLLEIEIYLAYEKHFRNLALQERRLSAYAARLRAELEQVQAKREADTRPQASGVPVEYTIGEFEFSTQAVAALSLTTPSHQSAGSIPASSSFESNQS